ncbi:hypothetical protein P43SY_005885 [Pythium insidiosum]|uniref:BZIP domain-containing protein n=1 Tax=Pythium insidiosum TaxID=114742 RepID=A0AAD5Q3E2_PYTIN|nr:hypothetical protein P43SY_005885 [Pythium insidiosum]
MFPSSRPQPLVSPLTAIATAATSDVPASNHVYHPQHHMLASMQHAGPTGFSTVSHGNHDGVLPPALVAPLSASYQHAMERGADRGLYGASYVDGTGMGDTMPKKPKRKRKYTDATRAKHREVQRRFILRKKERMQQEKQLAVDLEKKVQLLQLLSETRSLQLEQVDLVQQCIAHGVDLHWKQVASYLEDDASAIAASFQPLRAGEWHDIVRETMHYIESFRPDDAFLDTPSAIGGWSQQSRIEHSTLSFRYSKAFADTPLTTELVDRVWQALSSSSSSTKIFGGGLAVKSKVLQVINDDTVVLFRAVFHPSTKEILRSVELASRVSRGWEQLILLQSLEGLNIQSLPGHQSGWLRGVTWCKVAPAVGSDGTAVEWTGCVGQCAEDKLQLWRRELPVMIARFETMVFSADICVAFNDQRSPTSEQQIASSTDAPSSSSISPRHQIEERKGGPQESDGDNGDSYEEDDEEEDADTHYRYDDEGKHGSDDSGSTCSDSSGTSAGGLS